VGFFIHVFIGNGELDTESKSERRKIFEVRNSQFRMDIRYPMNDVISKIIFQTPDILFKKKPPQSGAAKWFPEKYRASMSDIRCLILDV
jgi:hypothetical protein